MTVMGGLSEKTGPSRVLCPRGTAIINPANPPRRKQTSLNVATLVRITLIIVLRVALPMLFAGLVVLTDLLARPTVLRICAVLPLSLATLPVLVACLLMLPWLFAVSGLITVFGFVARAGADVYAGFVAYNSHVSNVVPKNRPTFTLKSTTRGNKIIKQHSYAGQLCIPSELADLQIDDPAMLLTMLNDILGTDHSFHTTPSLRHIMIYCIQEHYDLGMVYGMLRRFWPDIVHSSKLCLSYLKRLEREDKEFREQAVVKELVVERFMPPRRLWDLYSNRVLPFWVAIIQTVSHAWMSHEARRSVLTRINGNQWPVPIPRDSNLDDLRIELLNLQRHDRICEYVWLDVICLRQAYDWEQPHEQILRAKEWEVDVPTIGTIYQHCWSTVVYLNGLGRSFEEDDLDSKRHWCNRAWTVQELLCSDERGLLLGGVTNQSPSFDILDPFCPDEQTAQPQSRFPSISIYEHILNPLACDIITVAATMSRRQAESDIDKIAGLACFVCSYTQPVFHANQEVNVAWQLFVACMAPVARGQLFFRIPIKGDGKFEWLPSWHQLLKEAEVVAS
ncbi:hypothetical protein PENSPDRAFT_696872, partial [Peniophora sp. CONT]